jgi:hypothetical protein
MLCDDAQHSSLARCIVVAAAASATAGAEQRKIGFHGGKVAVERPHSVRLGGPCIPRLSFAQFRNITGYGGGLQDPSAGVTGLMNFLSPALSGGSPKRDHRAISAPLSSPSTRGRLFVLKDARKSRTSEVGPFGSIPKAAC